MKDFVIPQTDTKVIGKPAFGYGFQIHARLDPSRDTQTPRGGRVFQGIESGTVSGPRLNGTVYPNSGADLGLIQRDGTVEINTRFMVKADTTEWIYIEHRGYQRKDGYYRIQALIDSDKQGKYASLTGGIWLATAELAANGTEAVYTYFEVM